jgi:threonyl-tRNA synthetase
MRVRTFAQDDAHIFCEPDQLGAEVDSFFEFMREVYQDLGLGGVEMAVSTRPEKFLGEPEDWDWAEKTLIEAVEKAGYTCRIKAGEAVFYAPKVELDFRDVLGRSWTLGTIQIDLAMPGRFGLRYVGRDGEYHQPTMLHRAVLGSLERFMAIYIEHTGGDFPLWLSPIQAIVLPIAERHEAYGSEVVSKLINAGVRAELDDRSETLAFKIREAETQKIPIMLVVGDREAEAGKVAPRLRRSKHKIDPVGIDEILERFHLVNAERQQQMDF